MHLSQRCLRTTPKTNESTETKKQSPARRLTTSVDTWHRFRSTNSRRHIRLVRPRQRFLLGILLERLAPQPHVEVSASSAAWRRGHQRPPYPRAHPTARVGNIDDPHIAIKYRFFCLISITIDADTGVSRLKFR